MKPHRSSIWTHTRTRMPCEHWGYSRSIQHNYYLTIVFCFDIFRCLFYSLWICKHAELIFRSVRYCSIPRAQTGALPRWRASSCSLRSLFGLCDSIKGNCKLCCHAPVFMTQASQQYAIWMYSLNGNVRANWKRWRSMKISHISLSFWNWNGGGKVSLGEQGYLNYVHTYMHFYKRKLFRHILNVWQTRSTLSDIWYWLVRRFCLHGNTRKSKNESIPIPNSGRFLRSIRKIGSITAKWYFSDCYYRGPSLFLEHIRLLPCEPKMYSIRRFGSTTSVYVCSVFRGSLGNHWSPVRAHEYGKFIHILSQCQ